MSKNEYNDLFNDANTAFDSEYKEELNKLKGLSEQEIAQISPSAKKSYSELIKVIEDASRKNLSQAELIERIKKLGSVAVKIAKKIPKFAALLV